MDQLFKRYADPFLFMDGYIQAGKFEEFVVGFVERVSQEKEDEKEWEVWLHKIYEQSFNDFREEIRTNTNNQNMSAGTIETTVQDSLDILKTFTPK